MREKQKSLDVLLKMNVQGMNDSELRMLKYLVDNETNRRQTERREKLNKDIEKGYISSYEDL